MKSLFWRLVALAIIAVIASAPAHAQFGGAKPITLIVPFAPGGGTDILTRMIAPRLAEKLGTPVVVENKPGASGAIAAQFTARAAPDGRTLMVGSTSEIGINPSLYPKLAGVGSGAHLAAELFFYETKIKLTHIPYKGVGPAIADIMGAQRDLILFTTLTSIASLARAGQIRAVAVSSKERVSVMPELPTFIESGVPRYVMEYWYGLMAPAATPADILQKIHATAAEVLREREMVASLAKQALQPSYRTREEFAAFIKADMERWAAVVKAANITPEQ